MNNRKSSMNIPKKKNSFKAGKNKIFQKNKTCYLIQKSPDIKTVKTWTASQTYGF